LAKAQCRDDMLYYT